MFTTDIAVAALGRLVQGEIPFFSCGWSLIPIWCLYSGEKVSSSREKSSGLIIIITKDDDVLPRMMASNKLTLQ